MTIPTSTTTEASQSATGGERRKFNFLIDVPMENHWENVDRMRMSVLNCISTIFSGLDRVECLATTLAELLENAVKYGHWHDGATHLHVRVWGDRESAHIQVENPVDTKSTHVAKLLEIISWLKSFDNAEDAYRARLLQVATSPSGVSQLGLARIAYEGCCSVDAVLDGETLRVTTVSRL
jgi:hypothetical protein